MLFEKEQIIEEKKRSLTLSDKAGHVMPILRSVTELEDKETELLQKLEQETARYEKRKEDVKVRKKHFSKLETEKESKESGLLSSIERAKESAKGLSGTAAIAKRARTAAKHCGMRAEHRSNRSKKRYKRPS